MSLIEQRFNDAVVQQEMKKLEDDVNEELSKENVDKDKVYKLRFQQLMKGIELTQSFPVI